MKILVVCVFIYSFLSLSAQQSTSTFDSNALGISLSTGWAVLVAGSNGYSNYRHQADVCHAYKTLINKGLKASRIIVLAYDDIATHPYNPFPGQIFNKPSAGAGNDVYNGCVIDYKGDDVTPSNYINVITGNSAAMSGIGTGRVLQSNNTENVFIYFSDHGGYGLVAFPNQYLYVNAFQNALLTMYNNQMFKELVYYLEACESGSMFLGFPIDKNIYGVTASNPYQSSYATYCSSSDTVNGIDLNTCLGDLFSVSFLEDTDAANTFTRTLQQQFLTVKALTSSSVVTQYGQLNFTNKNIGKWFGEKLTIIIKIPLLYKYFLWLSIWDARLVKLQTLFRLWQNQIEDHCRKQEFYEEAHKITKISLAFENITQKLNLTLSDCDKKEIIIREDDCVQKLVEIFEKGCMSFGEYGLKFVYYIVYICQEDRRFQTIEEKANFLLESCPQDAISFEDYAIESGEFNYEDTLIVENRTELLTKFEGGHNRLLSDYLDHLRKRF